jgi:DNA-binding transcriptional LysR family regulator
MVEAKVGLGVVPEVSARRHRRSMAIEFVRLSDPWAKRRLTICVNRRDALPMSARRLVDHLIAAS